MKTRIEKADAQNSAATDTTQSQTDSRAASEADVVKTNTDTLAFEFKQWARGAHEDIESIIEDETDDTVKGRLFILLGKLKHTVAAGEALAAYKTGQGTASQASLAVEQTDNDAADAAGEIVGQQWLVVKLIKDWRDMTLGDAAVEMENTALALRNNPLFSGECEAMRAIFQAYNTLTNLQSVKYQIDHAKVSRDRLNAAEFWFGGYWQLINDFKSEVPLALLMENLRGLGVILNYHLPTAALGAAVSKMERGWDVLCLLVTDMESL